MQHRHLEKPFALSQLRALIAEQLEQLGRCSRDTPARAAPGPSA
jgi:hypothetical protein